MRVDAKTLPLGARLEADVAVVGSGPAGIVLALELAKTGARILLIESGGDSYSARAQKLGDTVGKDPPHVPMSITTRRQIGGASNLWAGRCVPFDRVDFEPREVVGDARWPVAYDEVERYFSRASEWLVCGEAVFDAREIPNLAGLSLIPDWPEEDVRTTSLERWSLPTNFGRQYRARLEASSCVTLVTNLTCTEILCAPDGQSVDQLIARTFGGNRVTIRALRYVLACGGLEATRLLMASNRKHPKGIGNHSGHLGHWYMAHVESRIARVHLATPSKNTTYDYERDPAGVYVRRRFTFAPSYLLEHGLPNVALWLTNPEIGDASHGSEILSLIYLALSSSLGGYLVAEGIRQSQLKVTTPTSKWSHLLNLARDPGSAIRFALDFGFRRFIKSGRKVPGIFVPNAWNVYPLTYHAEHLPSYSSRVELTSERDALGVPRLRTRLHFGEADISSVIRGHRHFDAYLKRHGFGHLEYLYDDPQKAIRGQLYGGYHQAGTTRMSADPQDGVLTPDLAVHGFTDLFLASSSAFVTSSQANTTFMIVAFALRLAEHLAQSMGEVQSGLRAVSGSA